MRGVFSPLPPVVDRALLARKVAAVTDAVERIRGVLPETAEGLASDRTAREVVILNLFVAVQECLSLAAHWLADEGWAVPPGYREVFLSLADHGIIDRELAVRLASASGLRNLVAHQYAALDWSRVHETARLHLDDLITFCGALARKAGSGG